MGRNIEMKFAILVTTIIALLTVVSAAPAYVTYDPECVKFFCVNETDCMRCLKSPLNGYISEGERILNAFRMGKLTKGELALVKEWPGEWENLRGKSSYMH